MQEIPGKEGVQIIGTRELLQEVERIAQMEESVSHFNQKTLFESSLAGHIIQVFEDNKAARRDSGIEEEMLDSLYAFNCKYTSKDLDELDVDDSTIYMPLTSTKVRACASWIKDILMPAKGKPWSIKPSKVEEIPQELMDEIQSRLDEEFQLYMQEVQKEQQKKQQEMQQGAGEPGGPESPPPGEGPQEAPRTKAGEAARALREMNSIKRDIKETIEQEIEYNSLSEMKQMEDMIEDQLQSGKWDRALSDFIEDFCVFPTAFMKGPVIQIKDKLRWVQGKPEVMPEYCYVNKRINPLDVYPSPNATDITDGALVEHMRLSRKEISAMRYLPGYKKERIDEVLDNYTSPDFVTWFHTSIEDEKAEAEYRGTSSDSNKNTIHALHYWGPAQVRQLRDWGYEGSEIDSYDYHDEVEIEAILVDSVVIKAIIADDPLGRRPYYKASFQNRPGSFWGRSLPNLMDPIQRMCNATARALANNMGLASGPQVEVYTDRLADDTELEDIYPFKIWQVQSDPSGSGGRAVTFNQPSSNAAELLAVYKEFELRADDATGIPRYAYGNERTGGAAQTASGLSMLLESASKGIKDAIRHIDYGLIIPRVEYQFYWNLIQHGEKLNYTGDIHVVGVGSGAHTLKAAEQGKRMEFLQAISGNPQIMEVVGAQGMAEIFRTMLEDINISEVTIPSRLELRLAEKQKAESAAGQQQQMMQLEQEKSQTGLKATQIQSEGQQRMNAEAMKRKDRELDLKEADLLNKSKLKSEELVSRERQQSGRQLSEAARAEAEREQRDLMQRRQLAFDLQNAMSDQPIEAATEGRRAKIGA